MQRFIFLEEKRKAAPNQNCNDDGDGSENVKKTICLLSKTTTLHVHHAFLYISLPPLQDYTVQRENASFYVLWSTYSSDDEFLFLFLNFSAVTKKSTPGKFAHI